MDILRFGLGELIAAIPALVECEPREAVVAVSISDDAVPTCALIVPRAVLLDPHSAPATAAAVAEELAVERGRAIVLICYTESDIWQGCPALETLRMEVEFVVPQVEVLAVSGDVWFSPGCTDDECCPRRLPEVPDALVGAIHAARRDTGSRGRAAQRRPAPRATLLERASAADLWGAALQEGRVADAATARRMAASLDDLCVRDWVVLTIMGADEVATQDALAGHDSGAVGVALDDALSGHVAPDLSTSERTRGVMERVARAARGRSRRAATQTLLGLLDWWEGDLDSAYARCVSALAHDHRYRLAELLEVATSRGIAPGWVVKAQQTGAKGASRRSL